MTPQTITATRSITGRRPASAGPGRIRVFAIDQEYLNYVKENPDAAKRAAQERQVGLELLLAGGMLYPHKGTFSLVDRQVDVRTGTLRLEGLFPNPGNILRPGQFARVRAITKTKKDALLIPQRAVTELQGSYQVGVVGEDNTVEIRPVKVSERIGTHQNTVNPAGQIGAEPVPPGQEFTYTVRAQGRLLSAEEPAAVIAIYQLPGSKAIDTMNRAKQVKRLRQFRLITP